MVMSPVGHGTKYICAGEDQHQYLRADLGALTDEAI
jgi:hypothetical protein